ncbi:hypothetical protein C8R43DRAFT_871348, partial [Mycena crocata]
LLKQFAPRMQAYMKAQLEALQDKCAIAPAFPDSAFSTAEFSFGDAPAFSGKSFFDAIHSFRAITVLGVFDPNHSSICVLPADNIAFRCPPGTTFLLPGSVTEYFFSNVRKGEKRYLFQQFFHAGVQRYMDRGFRSDVKYDMKATAEEKAEVEKRLGARVPFTVKLLSRENELFV